ncbi:hypothetical protein GOODEAATRI_004605 [Goodea atripinnis]|uniref:Uncharacterized protein n=1 Tax=Goodea atripinnis TaxID=208336 RepID=A0ABV0N7X6_9TELE
MIKKIFFQDLTEGSFCTQVKRQHFSPEPDQCLSFCKFKFLREDRYIIILSSSKVGQNFNEIFPQLLNCRKQVYLFLHISRNCLLFSERKSVKKCQFLDSGLAFVIFSTR